MHGRTNKIKSLHKIMYTLSTNNIATDSEACCFLAESVVLTKYLPNSSDVLPIAKTSSFMFKRSSVELIEYASVLTSTSVEA